MPPQQQESEVRGNILDSFLRCPHRNVQELVDLHNEMMGADPVFYGHLGVWAQENTPIRDHHELFIARMFLSDWPEHREAAYVMFQSLPPYQANRVLDHIKGVTTSKSGKGIERESRFGRNLPRIARSAVKTYLRTREAKPDLFDGAALRAKKALKSLYCRVRIAPSDRAKAILFGEGEIPEGRYLQAKKLLTAETPEQQARIIVENKIPLAVASSAIKEISGLTLAALIDVMSPQELLNNLGRLKKYGAMDHSDLRLLIEAKLKEAGKANRVDALKASQAAKAVGLKGAMAQKVKEVTDEQLSKKAIKRPTALLIDTSGSMEVAVEIAKTIAPVIASRCTSTFKCYAFDTLAQEVKVEEGSSHSVWDKALSQLRISGWTSCGSAIRLLSRSDTVVEQIIIITDEHENRAPYFVDELQKYANKIKFMPHVVIIRCGHGATTQLQQQMEQENIAYDVFDARKTDYYAVPAILSMLTRPDKLELLMEIMETPLPTR